MTSESARGEDIYYEIKSAVRLYSSDQGVSTSAEKSEVIKSLVVAGYSHEEIEDEFNRLIDIGEIYYPADGEVAVI